MQRFMITDNSDIVRKVGKRILSELDFLVSEASNAGEALQRCQTELPEYLIVVPAWKAPSTSSPPSAPWMVAKKSRSTTASSRRI
ncbi:UNVERIFIED_ORG: hypothetical protein GGI57_004802 [Rhizobium aethiopicum]